MGNHKINKTTSEKADIKLARSVIAEIKSIVHFYRWIKYKMIKDCYKTEVGFGKILTERVFHETTD